MKTLNVNINSNDRDEPEYLDMNQNNITNKIIQHLAHLGIDITHLIKKLDCKMYNLIH